MIVQAREFVALNIADQMISRQACLDSTLQPLLGQLRIDPHQIFDKSLESDPLYGAVRP